MSSLLLGNYFTFVPKNSSQKPPHPSKTFPPTHHNRFQIEHNNNNSTQYQQSGPRFVLIKLCSKINHLGKNPASPHPPETELIGSVKSFFGAIDHAKETRMDTKVLLIGRKAISSRQ